MTAQNHWKQARFKRWIRDSSLTWALLLLFLITAVAQGIFGFKSFNEELKERGEMPLASFSEYATHGNLISSLAENWESEFLQMAVFVWLTRFLVQKGSAESKPPREDLTKEDLHEEKEEEKYSRKRRAESPFWWRVYENSLTLGLLILFSISFFVHIYGHEIEENEKRIRQGMTVLSFGDVLAQAEFWFESMQNWQSEFLSIAVMGVMSIYLRQKNSPQSKKLRDPNSKTGGD
jgi:hypothetical protein